MSAFVFNITFDCVDPRALSEFWAAVTGYTATETRDDFVRLRAPDSRGVRHILFFRVPEPKAVKNRMHVDLATRERETEITRLKTLGATEVDRREGNDASWVVMLDPEGNEFCIG